MSAPFEEIRMKRTTDTIAGNDGFGNVNGSNGSAQPVGGAENTRPAPPPQSQNCVGDYVSGTPGAAPMPGPTERSGAASTGPTNSYGAAAPNSGRSPSLGPRFTLWTIDDFARYVPPPDADIIAGVVAEGQLSGIVGQGGVGKSRLTLQAALCQITGREWCGLSVSSRPRRWLFIGNENSCRRIKTDLAAMLQDFSPDGIQLIREHLAIHAQVTADDTYIAFTPVSQLLFRQAIGEHRAEVVVIDPWSNFHSGDLMNHEQTRGIIGQWREFVSRLNPSLATWFVNHARTGKANIAKATGYDAGDFSFASKAFHQAMRGIVNVAPGDPNDSGKLVIACGKGNDFAKWETRGVEFDPETHLYVPWEGFDVGAWEADVSGQKSGGTKSLTIADVIEVLRACGGKSERPALIDKVLAEKKVSAKTVERRLQDGNREGYVRTDKTGLIYLTEKGRGYKG